MTTAAAESRIPTPESPIAWIDEDVTTSPRQPLGIVLVIDPDDGAVHIERQHSIDGTAAETWHNRRVEFGLPSNADALAVAAWVNGAELGALLARVVAGYAARWDGSNEIGTYTEDAGAALDAVSAYLDDAPTLDEGGFIEAADWFSDMGRFAVAEEYGITAGTTDDELSALATRIDAEAKSDGWYLSGALGYLESVRETSEG